MNVIFINALAVLKAQQADQLYGLLRQR